MSISSQNTQRSAGTSGHAKLRFCRALLSRLDPARPPATTKPKEFRWQYRALSERVDVFAERLEKTPAHPGAHEETALQRAEYAIDLSLLYFQDVLAPKTEGDEEV